MKLLLAVLFACVWLSQARRAKVNNSPVIHTKSLLKNINQDNSTEIPKLKIINGTVSDISLLPYQVSIVRRRGNHDCGACIISSTYLLSAAQCWISDTDFPAYARVGSTSLKKTDLIFNGFQSKVLGAFIHPFYQKFAKDDFDVALVLVKTPFKFGKTIAAIQLPASGEVVPDNTMCTVSGWGFTADGGQISQDLMSVQVPIVTTSACLRAYGGRSRITERMVCAGFKTGGKGTCQFDSGGPLACNKKLGGIVSWGTDCTQPNAYGVYVDVGNSEIRDWITEVSGI